MKKILLLALVMIGGVSTLFAENVTRRILVEDQFWFTSEKLYLLAYYNNGESNVDLASWGTEMNFIASYEYSSKYRRIFYYDITADESIFNGKIWLQFYTNKEASDNSQNRSYWEGKYDKDKIFYIYPTGDNNNYIGTSNSDVVFYLVKVEKNGNNENVYSKLADLSYSNGIATGTYTNSATTMSFVAPNYALYDNFAGVRSWSYVYRASDNGNDYEISSFQKYTPSIDATDKVFKFTYIGSMDLSFNIFDKTSTITPYFEREITSAGIATFSSQYAVAVPDGVTASYVTGVGSNNVLTTTAISNGIPANTGVLLEGSADIYTFTPATSTDAVTGNKLVAVSADGTVNQIEEDNTNYILTTNGDASARARFYKVNSDGNAITAGKAYLQLPTHTTAREYFDIWSEANSINDMVQEQQFDGKVYNLAGQRVAQPTKGLYIVNGKKVIKK